MVVFGAKGLYSGKSGCISGKSGCFCANKWLYAGKEDVLEKKWLYSGKSCCIRANVFVFR